MKRLNKKILFIIVSAILSSALVVSAYAEIAAASPNGSLDFEYTYSGMSAEKAEMIVSSWVSGSSNGYQVITPANIFCLFGHDIKVGYITQTYHSCRSESPRCRQIVSYMEYCGRDGCSYSKVISETAVWLTCH